MARHAIVLLLVWGLTPGLVEVTENAWHLVATGHAAHRSDQGPSHAPEDDEHGCSGPFHLCSCHHSLVFDLLPVPGAGRIGEPWHGASPGGLPTILEPPLPGLDRPPRA